MYKDDDYVCHRYARGVEWIHLPCMVGDKMFVLAGDIYEYEIIDFQIKKYIIWATGFNHYYSADVQRVKICISYLGKTVFLTLEEAQKALAERKTK